MGNTGRMVWVYGVGENRVYGVGNTGRIVWVTQDVSCGYMVWIHIVYMVWVTKDISCGYMMWVYGVGV